MKLSETQERMLVLAYLKCDVFSNMHRKWPSGEKRRHHGSVRLTSASLKKRGLMHEGVGYELTEEGEELAKKLLGS